MLSNIIAISFAMKSQENIKHIRESDIDYNGKLEGCDQSNTINYTAYDYEILPIYKIASGQYKCIIGNILIGSDSDIVGISGFPDENSNFVYSNLIQKPLVAMGKTNFKKHMSDQPFPITRIGCKDKTKSCSVQIAYLPTVGYMKNNDPEEGPTEASVKLVVDTKSNGQNTLKTYQSKDASGTIKRFSSIGIFISKSDRKFRKWEMEGVHVMASPGDFIYDFSNKTMSSLTPYWTIVSQDREEFSEEIYEFRFKYDEIPDSESLAPFLFRDDLSLTIPTKYGLRSPKKVRKLKTAV
ncbi:hypothetical protein TVAG_304780 [Trichomonas vaginalis G3]|uniref:Uncharacterized protein n=1 Tax=Trichomonas vaginalis (strain ATCC PRA-98 / G3) TaxID=412133 RepID=A2F2R3_TRIV3|nr:hypothetical protein TVAGG3_1020140 [Trichomonas vaginalis G3]EAY00837.1 hypothetical protein TVAG_304780 [Trichomonas vaginalis G3]KAI5492078.1 hypothetical protein TVAGG3_1020140 [Trichomonas vaginalis G3]|eukprot:XP_001313766.1 hypothetical protein [Trichomonas vaginalis G3]